MLLDTNLTHSECYKVAIAGSINFFTQTERRILTVYTYINNNFPLSTGKKRYYST